jgi:hypothetical protein
MLGCGCNGAFVPLKRLPVKDCFFWASEKDFVQVKKILGALLYG